MDSAGESCCGCSRSLQQLLKHRAEGDTGRAPRRVLVKPSALTGSRAVPAKSTEYSETEGVKRKQAAAAERSELHLQKNSIDEETHGTVLVDCTMEAGRLRVDPLRASKWSKSGTKCTRRLTCANGTSRTATSALFSWRDQHRR